MSNTKVEFDYFYANTVTQFRFINIPALLLTSTCFENLSLEAKIAYSFLLDRNNLQQAEYFNEIISSLSNNDASKISSIMTELENVGLIKLGEDYEGNNRRPILEINSYVDVIRLNNKR